MASSTLIIPSIISKPLKSVCLSVCLSVLDNRMQPLHLDRYNPDIHHRRSVRLREYDYSQAGMYFVTICTQDRQCLFGKIRNGEMVLNDAGRMVERWWVELTNKYQSIDTDAYVIMPNHFHGIIMIVGAALCGRPDELRNHPNRAKGNHIGKGTHTGVPLRVLKQTAQRQIQPTLGDVMDWFKTMTTNEYIRGIKEYKWSPSPKLWQRNYYEHIIHNDDELNKIREYIMNNPVQWELDEENPDCVGNNSVRRGDPVWSP